ncbi:MAG TPA: phosphate-starvation-inducible PsiE family protein [Deltaproteobacteria bacterium]|nr:phosphate-starvation-inducible PsiE family protein [Deltaproteobacteria bacterium]HPJ93335.1 phosphate-starvation-inducible PsiE family protein [Deltaproteobacteria bacterium]HPR51795.1 phosphate-starvation-inducible PsiE family protein [Deltaproteobacteria bacterium]
MAFGTKHSHKIFNFSLQIIINILVVYIIVVLVIGLGKTLLGINSLLTWGPVGSTFAGVVTEILTFLVIIELFRSFVEYFREHRIRLNNMMDPAIIFVIRELIVDLYTQDSLSWQTLMGFSILILSLGVVRTLAVRFSPKDGDEGIMHRST